MCLEDKLAPTLLVLVCPTAADIVSVFLIVPFDDLSCLAPLEVIRVKERIHEDDDVHKWGSKEVEEVPNKVLHTLETVAWKPETDAERVQLQRVSQLLQVIDRVTGKIPLDARYQGLWK